ncbi:reverse transcriptase domain-containing protein [Tanacetum coccineum]
MEKSTRIQCDSLEAIILVGTFVRISESCISLAGREKVSTTLQQSQKMRYKEASTDHWNEMCYQLLKLMTKQRKNPERDPRLRLENPHIETLTDKEIENEFSDEYLMMLKTKFNDDEPWRRCVAESEIFEILAHCHSRPTRGHHSASVTARKVYKSGFYWPSVFKDAKEYVMKCDACQRSGNISSRSEMHRNNIRFVFPKALISDRGTHFCNFQLERALQKYGVTHKLSTTYHPQYNGQTEVTNNAIKRILKRSVGCNPKDWLEYLNDALWAFRTAYKTPTRYSTIASKNHFMQLNELAELRDGAYENTIIYKEGTKKWHDSILRGDTDFKVGDKVLLYNSRLKIYPGKLKSKWYGPNIVKTVYPYGAVEITDKNGFSFKVSGQRLKKYYEDNIDREDEEVVEFVSMHEMDKS